MTTLLGLLPLLVLLVLWWPVRRHRHRWTAWSAPVDQDRGRPAQFRHCAIQSCNLYQHRRV